MSNTHAMEAQCDFCDQHYTRAAYKSCVECEAHFCHSCLETCHSRGPYRNHSLVEPATLCDHVVQKCSTHKETLKLFCVPCSELICLECKVTENHANHDAVSIAVGKRKLKVRIGN